MNDYYNQEEVWKRTNSRTEKRLEDTLSIVPRNIKSILDIGCGDGRFTNRLKGFENVIGFDRSKTGLKKLVFLKILGNSDKIPIKDKTIDLVIATELLEHLDDYIFNNTISEIERITKRYILISVPYRQKPYETFVKCKNCALEYSPISHQRYFNKKIIKNLFPDTKKKIKLIGLKRYTPFITPILKRIGHKICENYLNFNNCICPNCGSTEIKTGFNNKICELYSGFIWRFTLKTPDWIVCLYEMDVD